MRVECKNVEEFLTCLKAEKFIFQDVVRIGIYRRPKGTDPDPVVFNVVLQASALVLVDEESQFLLEVGCDCGKDFDDETQDFEGSNLASNLKAKIEMYAASRKWKTHATCCR